MTNKPQIAGAYYNMRTQEYEFLDESPADWADYLPQSESAQQLYKLYQMEGDTPIVSAKKVLELSTGTKAQP